MISLGRRIVRSMLRRSIDAGSLWRTAVAAASGTTLGHAVKVAPGCEIALTGSLERRGRLILDDRCRLDRGVIIHPYGGQVTLGIDVYIGAHTVIYGHGGVTIGKDTLISMHCRIVSANHAIPVSGTIIRSVADMPAPIVIGQDVWLGAGVTVLAGVTIGNGSVVGAGAVVTHDLPAGSIAVGVPARVIRQRS